MTPEHKQTLEKARELLPKVTPGPWSINAHNDVCAQVDGEHHAICTDQFCFNQEKGDNAALIALSPDLAALSDTLARRVEVLTECTADLLRLHMAGKDHPATNGILEKARDALSATQPKEPRT